MPWRVNLFNNLLGFSRAEISSFDIAFGSGIAISFSLIFSRQALIVFLETPSILAISLLE